MFRFKETVLPFNKKLVDSLTKIFGIGKQRASYISDLLGFNYFFNINDLNFYFFECINLLMKHNYILEDRLRYNIKNRFVIFKEAGLIKSKRIESGLPVRGQRTHSNAKSQKRRKIYY